jgi:amino acid permease
LLIAVTDWNNAAVILQYWVPATTVPIWAWYLIFWVLFSTITTLGVGFYGEIEYFFGMFKFIALAVLFFVSILSNVGAFGNGYVGFRYWEEPYGLSMFLIVLINLPFTETTISGPIKNGINGFGQVFVLAAAFYVGTEIVSVAAGESRNPRRDVPRVRAISHCIRRTFTDTCKNHRQQTPSSGVFYSCSSALPSFRDSFVLLTRRTCSVPAPPLLLLHSLSASSLQDGSLPVISLILSS